MKKHPLDFPGSQAAEWGPYKRVFNVMGRPESSAFDREQYVLGWPTDEAHWDRASLRSLTPIGPVAKALLRVSK